MATSTLHPPTLDDTMEMSSPAIRNLDDDIDIDFEDYGEMGVGDEQMGDGDMTRPPTAHDELMGEEQSVAHEAEMRDHEGSVGGSLAHEHDEDLIDYGEEDLQEELSEQALPVNATELETELEAELHDEAPPVEMFTPRYELSFDSLTTLQAGEHTVEDSAIDPPPAEQYTGTVANEAPFPSTDNADNQEAIARLDAEPSAREPQTAAVDVAEFGLGEDELTLGISTTENTGRTATVVIDGPVNTNVSNEEHSDLTTVVTSTHDHDVASPSSPTDTGLHPMTVHYNNFQWDFFSTQHQPDGLLKDDNLASVGLASLLEKCRENIAIKTGVDIPDEHELVLGFPSLGLSLVESCPAAFQTTLTEIVDVYLILHENEAYEKIPDLSVIISTQYKFSSSLELLKQAATNGQGISAVGYGQHIVQADSYSHDESQYEEYDEGGLEGAAPPQDYAGENAYNEEGEEYRYGDEAEEHGHGGGDDEAPYHDNGEEHSLQEEAYQGEDVDSLPIQGEKDAASDAAHAFAFGEKGEYGTDELITGEIYVRGDEYSDDSHESADASSQTVVADTQANDPDPTTDTFEDNNTNNEHSNHAPEGYELHSSYDWDPSGQQGFEQDKIHDQFSSSRQPVIEDAHHTTHAGDTDNFDEGLYIEGHDEPTYDGDGAGFDDQGNDPHEPSNEHDHEYNQDNAEDSQLSTDNIHNEEAHEDAFAQEAASAEGASVPVDRPEDAVDPDNIGFDDDTEEEYQARKASEAAHSATVAALAANGHASPPGKKRSFDSLEVADNTDVKKLRAS